MDNRRLFINIAVVLTLFVAYKLTLTGIYKRHPTWPGGPKDPAQVAATQPAAKPAAGPTSGPTTTPAVTPVVASANTFTTAPAVAVPVGLHAEDVPVAPAVRLGSTSGQSNDPAYPLGVTVEPTGAGLAVVTLNDYWETDQRQHLYTFQTPYAASADNTRPLATRGVSIDGRELDLVGVRWRATAATADSATFTLRLLDGSTPTLELTKTFRLQRRDAADGSDGFEVAVAQSFRNLTGKPMAVVATVNGPTPPTGENTRGEDRRFTAAFDDGDQFVKTSDTLVTDLGTTKPAKDLATAMSLPLLWVGTCNSYFDAIVRPDAGAAGAVKIASAPAYGLDDKKYDAAFAFTTNSATVPAGAAVPFDFHAFFGPKQRSLLTSNYYAAFPRKYDLTLVYTSGFCGFLTFGWLIKSLYWVLWAFHFVFRDWGLAIIGLVLLVRTCLHPITKRAQINMMGMSKMGPEIERLKKKYGDDKDALNKAMMGVYREQGLTPILGCLPMFLQTPIWLALWAALSSTFEIRQAPFLHFGRLHLTWINDLSRPDALVSFGDGLNLHFFTLHGINVLPILLAGVFYLQQSMQPVPQNMTPEQEQQRKMMKFMPLIYPLFFYVSPSGLNLYMLTSTSVGIAEGKIVRDHIKAREAAEAAGQIIIDAPPKRGGNDVGGPKNRGGPKGGGKPPTQAKSWFATKFGELQQQVEQAVREAERRKNQKR